MKVLFFIKIFSNLKDGNVGKLDSIKLEGGMVRGFVFYKGTEAVYQMVKTKTPCVLVLDSQGYLHNFSYDDTRSLSSNLLANPMEFDTLTKNKLIPAVLSHQPILSTDLFGLESVKGKEPLKICHNDIIHKRHRFDLQGCCKPIQDSGLGDSPYMLGILFF